MKRKFSAGRPQAFTLIELLVAIAIIAILASLLAPALAKAKSETHKTRCISNLRQMAIGLRLYAEDNGERFPFANALTPGGAPRVEFIDYYTQTQPYTPTNGGIYLCPVDKGPFTEVIGGAVGLRTNDLPVRSSYFVLGGLYTQVSGGAISLKQRFTHDVSYPDRKFSITCGAIIDRVAAQVGYFTNTAHAKGRRPAGTFAFVDGHAELTRWSKIRRDPDAPNFSWNSIGWADLP